MKNTVLTTADERKLVTAVLQNDRKAILQLIRLYERLVVAMVFKMIDKPPDREDICQDVFLKIFSHLKTFKFDSKLSTWIAQITYNTSVNYLQKKKTLLLDEVFTNYPLNDTDDEQNNYAETITTNFMHQTVAMPDELLQQSETNQLLQTAIEGLPIMFRTLVQLYHIEDMSYTDIAQITQLPLNTVKSYLFRARKLLKDVLQQHQFAHH